MERSLTYQFQMTLLFMSGTTQNFQTYSWKDILFLKEVRNEYGSLTFRLRRYLCCLQESPSAWKKLHKKLQEMKFKTSTADPEDGNMFLTIHIDDMLLISPTKTSRLIFEKEMEYQFEKKKQVNNISYLKMTIEKIRDDIKLNQLRIF